MTAVEWLLANLISEPISEADFEHNKECWIKAKEIEKQQIIDAANLQRNDYRGMPTYNKSGEQYYNETFKK